MVGTQWARVWGAGAAWRCATLVEEAKDDDFSPAETDEAENMRSASRKRFIRRMAPLLACLPRYPSQPRRMLPSFTVSCSRWVGVGEGIWCVA